jgi:large exoprotein involved in heme utilization and adhesion
LIRANRIELAGIALNVDGEPILNDGLPVSSGLFVGAEGSSGNGGGLKVETQQLSIQDGALLQANTYSSGNAGNVNVLATDSIEISGVSKESGLPARITATSGGLPEFSDRLARTATGAGGNLTIRTNRLTVQDGGIISVNSRNRRAAGAGNINIRSNQIVLDNQAQLNAQTESGDGAGIQLSGVELLTLRRNSEISTSAGLNSGGGNGGDINIDADFILDAPGENSDINADAGQGNGGNITINAQGILGITEQNQRTPQSDITASSESGVDGEISISNPTIDPTRGIVELPSTIVDASQLIAQGCRAGNRGVTDALGEFVITGRGGLPPSPDDLASSSAVITDWAELDTQPDQQGLELGAAAGERASGVTQPGMTQSGVTQSIVEAQGWVMGQNGKVALVANAPTVTPHLPNWTVPYCTSKSLQNNEPHEPVPDSTRYETIEPVAVEGSIVP